MSLGARTVVSSLLDEGPLRFAFAPGRCSRAQTFFQTVPQHSIGQREEFQMESSTVQRGGDGAQRRVVRVENGAALAAALCD